MAGHKPMRQLAKKASEHGYAPTQERQAKPLAFQGIGSGQLTARWSATVPSAVQTSVGPQLMDFEAPIVEGAEGEDQPLIYGLDGMEKNNVVMEMCPNGPMLTFPVPSGYTVNWGPGATHIPLSKTPSGHLAFALDRYQDFPQPVPSETAAPPVATAAAPRHGKAKKPRNKRGRPNTTHRGQSQSASKGAQLGAPVVANGHRPIVSMTHPAVSNVRVSFSAGHWPLKSIL